MGKFKQLETDYPIPELLQRDIDAHGCTDAGLTEEQAEEIIDYYCRRRW